MSENQEPPPLFDNVDIFDKENDNNDDLFVSAIDVSLLYSFLTSRL